MTLRTAEIQVLLLALDNRLQILDSRKTLNNPEMNEALESAKQPVLDLIEKLDAFRTWRAK